MAAKRRCKAKQLELIISTWGGKRDGAGRKRVAAHRQVRHRARGIDAGRKPLLVTLRVRDEWRGLRNKAMRRALLDAVRRTNLRGLIRIVEFCFIDDHVHLIVEAPDARVLSRGMQGFGVRFARVLHAHHGRRGRVVSDRYHARDLSTPLEVRNAIAYVINNGRKHGYRFGNGRFDTCSSAPWSPAITGGTGPTPLPTIARPTATPTTWLLGTGWRRFHPSIDVDEIPGRA
jgi:REP element-mobilizing transposase RayT